MPTTSSFYVSKATNKVRPLTGTQSSYFIYSSNDPLNYGTAKYVIDVFSDNNHQQNAEKLRDVLDTAGISDKLFYIRIDTRQNL